MFVRDFQIVERPFPTVEERICWDPVQLLSGALHAARVEGEHLRGQVAPAGWPAPVGVAVDLVTGSPRPRDDGMLLTFAWDAAGARSLFPHFDADLLAAPFGDRRTQLSISGCYTAPGGTAGQSVDRLVLHRVAESTVRAFLLQVRKVLETPNDELPERRIA